MNPKLKTALQTVIFLGIGVFLLYLAFRDTNPKDLAEELFTAKPFYIVLSLISGYLAVVSRGIRWTYLLSTMGYKVKASHATHAVAFGYLVNMGVPRAGEVARCTSLYKLTKVPVDKMLGTVIVERVIDMIMVMALMGITLLLHLDHIAELINITRQGGMEPSEPADNNNFLYWIALALMIVAITFVALRNRIISHPLWQKVRDFWKGVKEGFKTVFTMKQKAAFIAHTLFIWFNYYFVVYIVFFALPATAHLSISDGLFIMMSASLGIIVPVPGGVGAYHFLVTMAMQILGVDNQSGLAYATIVHAAQGLLLIAAGIIGFVGLFIAGRKLLK
jgi:glycosyltransferase 2 family protein